MNTNLSWREAYQAALLEIRPEELRQRIDEAEGAIRQQMDDLRRSDSSSQEERQALDDALRMLRMLAATEGLHPNSEPSGLDRKTKEAS